jgi:hypothetical protein
MAFWCCDETNVRQAQLTVSSFRFTYSRSDKQVFPSLDLIGWYTVAPQPTARHIAFHEQVLP